MKKARTWDQLTSGYGWSRAQRFARKQRERRRGGRLARRRQMEKASRAYNMRRAKGHRCR